MGSMSLWPTNNIDRSSHGVLHRATIICHLLRNSFLVLLEDNHKKPVKVIFFIRGLRIGDSEPGISYSGSYIIVLWTPGRSLQALK